MEMLSGWLFTIQILTATFDDACFSSGCGNPHLELRLNQKRETLERSASWPISLRRRNSLSLSASLWTTLLAGKSGRNVSVGVRVTGEDVIYGFPRICASPRNPLVSVAFGSDAATLVEADCFNVSLELSWLCCGGRGCAGGENETRCDFGGDESSPRSVFLARATEAHAVPIWLTIVLGGVTVGLLCLCLLLLSLYLRKREKKRHFPPMTHPHQAMCRSPSEESKYEVPWDHKFRPLPDYVRDLANGSPARSPNAGSNSHE